jgi:hypothetical protein
MVDNKACTQTDIAYLLYNVGFRKFIWGEKLNRTSYIISQNLDHAIITYKAVHYFSLFIKNSKRKQKHN